MTRRDLTDGVNVCSCENKVSIVLTIIQNLKQS